MVNLGKMMKQAKELQDKMATLQEALAEMEILGSAGGGMVEITLNGKGEPRKVRIDPSVVKAEDTEMLEDLVFAAISDAKGKAEEASREKMSDLTGGLPLPPGMQLPF